MGKKKVIAITAAVLTVSVLGVTSAFAANTSAGRCLTPERVNTSASLQTAACTTCGKGLIDGVCTQNHNRVFDNEDTVNAGEISVQEQEYVPEVSQEVVNVSGQEDLNMSSQENVIVNPQGNESADIQRDGYVEHYEEDHDGIESHSDGHAENHTGSNADDTSGRHFENHNGSQAGSHNSGHGNGHGRRGRS